MRKKTKSLNNKRKTLIPHLQTDKEKEIRNCMYGKVPDISLLKQLCISNQGLLNNDNRKKAWELILNINGDSKIEECSASLEIEHQIDKDVDRSLFMYEEYKALNTTNKRIKRDELKKMLMYVVSHHYFYYQGFNSICSVLLLVLGFTSGSKAALKVAKYKLNDFLRERFDTGINPFLKSILELLRYTDIECYNILNKLSLPTFLLRWLITWFAHDVSHLDKIARIFDYLLVSHSSAIIYMTTAIIISLKEDLLNLQRESNDSCEEIFMLFQKYELDDIDVDAIIRSSEVMRENIAYSKILKNLPKDSPTINEKMSIIGEYRSSKVIRYEEGSSKYMLGKAIYAIKKFFKLNYTLCTFRWLRNMILN